MANNRFPYKKSQWADANPEKAKQWYEALERMGASSVRARLLQNDAGSPAALNLGSVVLHDEGFAEEWLAWHDQQTSAREASFRSWQIFWTRWAALAASVAALATAIGWIYTIATKGR
jgi:hypothetical protein